MTGAAAGGAAGQAGGDAGQQGEAQQGGEGAGQGPDFAALQQTLSQQGETLEGMREFLQSSPWQQIENANPDAQEALPPVDLDFLDPDVAATMDPQQLTAKLNEAIQSQATSVAEKMLNDRINPLQEQIAEQQRQSEVDQLIGEFPELAEAETAQPVLQAAEQLAQQMGQPNLAQSPPFWRLVYMAGRAADAAQEEQGEIPAPASLESGAGATPGGGGGDLGDQIVGAHRGASVLPF